jgi:hypothetical protein
MFRSTQFPATVRDFISTFMKTCAMRVKLFLLAVVAVLLLADQSAHAQDHHGDEWCVKNPYRWVPNGIKNVDGQTRTGRSCQMGFGMLGPDIQILQITVRPEHGVLGVSEKEENRRYVAYVPQKGFVGHDRFEVYLRYMPPHSSNSSFAVIKVEMDVTP